MMVQMCASFRYRSVKTQFLLLPPDLLPSGLLPPWEALTPQTVYLVNMGV